ncbi:hypothetical protein F7725_020364 [Dissostichus mawsoni]|uniref:Uncharacterized protein n=1 Tax=Dissostichus mawsoni TaxID=36200 RepID=A0A7J5YD27_DISMA|nr:hypothetical protein F7725_020364 [Dissostichus mawsoni]
MTSGGRWRTHLMKQTKEREELSRGGEEGQKGTLEGSFAFNIPITVSFCVCYNIAILFGVCYNIAIPFSICYNIAILFGVCYNIAILFGVCYNIAILFGVCYNIAILFGVCYNIGGPFTVDFTFNIIIIIPALVDITRADDGLVLLLFFVAGVGGLPAVLQHHAASPDDEDDPLTQQLRAHSAASSSFRGLMVAPRKPMIRIFVLISIQWSQVLLPHSHEFSDQLWQQHANINDDLNASLATADELSREFNSLLKEASSNNNTQTSSEVSPEKPKRVSSGSSNGSSSSKPLSPSSTTARPLDSVFSSSKSASPPVFYSPVSSPKIQRAHSPLPRAGSDSYSYGQQGPRMAPNSPRHNSPSQYDRSPRSSTSYMERGSSPSVMAVPASPFTSSSKLLSPYDGSQMGHRSPRGERSRSPVSSNYPMSSTLPRNFGVRQPEEGVHRQKNSGKWSETDLDVSYDKKPHHTYDKTEWLQPSVPNSSWRESNLDGPLPAPSPKKFHKLGVAASHLALLGTDDNRVNRVHSPYQPQPIISRISIPPTSSPSRQRKPIPLSVIMRLQNPRWGGRLVPHPRLMGGDVLNSGDIDAELERLDLVHHMPVIQDS